MGAMCRIPETYLEGFVVYGGRDKGKRTRINLLSLLCTGRVAILIRSDRVRGRSSIGDGAGLCCEEAMSAHKIVLSKYPNTKKEGNRERDPRSVQQRKQNKQYNKIKRNIQRRY